MASLDMVLVAAGKSSRMGFDKLTIKLFASDTVIATSFDACAACDEVRHIVVVCAAGRETEFAKLLGEHKKLFAIVAGGVERCDSVSAGVAALASTAPQWIGVHDAARPFVRPQMISQCFAAAQQVGAAALAKQVVDTLHRTDVQGLAYETVSRKNLWQVQTPQIARADWLVEICASHRTTDEIGALIADGHPAVMLENPYPNLKITTPADIAIAGEKPKWEK